MKKLLLVLALSLTTLLFLNIPKAYADHMMGADITYAHISKNKYKITLTFYRDCKGIPPPTSATVDIHNGCKNYNLSLTLSHIPDTCTEVSDLCPDQRSKSSCHGGSLPGCQQCFYSGTIDLGDTCKDWTFSWSSCCRSLSLTNISGYVGLYVEAHLNNTHIDNYNHSSSIFTIIPVIYVCAGQQKFFNQGSYSRAGDSLGYEILTPYITATSKVTYTSGFSAKYPVTCNSNGFHFNDTTGQFTFTPTKLEVSAIAIRVNEYHKYKGKWVKVGSIMRDIQIDVIKCNGTSPTASGIINLKGGSTTSPTSFSLCSGVPCSFIVYASDSDTARTVTFASNLSQVLAAASIVEHSTVKYADTVKFSWSPTGNDTGLHNLIFTFNSNDCPVNGSQIISYSIYVSPATYAGPDQYVCYGSKKGVQLKVVGGSHFVWSPPDGLNNDSVANPVARPTITTSYVVTSNLLSSCKNKDTVVVNVSPAIQHSAKAMDSAICKGHSTILIASAKGGGGFPFTFNWSTDGATNFSSDTNVSISPIAKTRYYLLSDNGYCPQYDTLSVNVHAVPRSRFNVIKPAVCPGITMYANFTDTMAGAYKFTWDFGGLTSSANSGPGPIGISSGTSGTYSVKLIVTDTGYLTNCADTMTNTVTVYPQPKANFSTVDTAGCITYTVNVTNLCTGLTNGGNTFNWTIGTCTSTDSTPKCQLTTAGVFSIKLTVTNGNGCVDTLTHNNAIFVAPDPIAMFDADRKPGDTIDLSIATVKFTNSSQNASMYTWTYGDGTSAVVVDSSTHTLSHTYARDGLFYTKLRACDKYGCCDSTSKYYTVYNFNDFFVPSAFTPNTDNINDHLGVLGKYVIKAHLTVFNRWGQLIYEGNDYQVICDYHCGTTKGWDGTFKGSKCPQDVYIWYAECDMINGMHIKKKGDVTLLR